MIEPRFVTRTHYQVDEPAFLKLLLLRCASPVRSDYVERVGARFVDEVSGRPDLGRATNLAAAKYLVDLGKALKMLDGNLVWSALGHTLPLVCRPVGHDFGLELDLKERIFFFRVFLEFDGAALLFAAREMLQSKEVPAPGQSWVDFANRMSTSVYSDYLAFATDIRARTGLRQALQKRQRQPFKGKSGPHQSFLHLHALYRFGLAERCSGNASRRYRPVNAGGSLRVLCEKVPDLPALETLIERNEWSSLAFEVFAQQSLGDDGSARTDSSAQRGLRLIRRLYEQVVETGVPLCPIQSLVEASQIEQIAAGSPPTPSDEVIQDIRAWQQQKPRDIRFHVDRYGRLAFIKLSDALRISDSAS